MARLTPCDPAELQRRYDGAVAAGCGVLLDRDDERLLACDELLAATMPYHGQLAVLAAVAAVAPASLRRLVAGLLRTTHAALIAHARDTGYDPDRWVRQAHFTAAAIDASEPAQLFELAEDALTLCAAAIPALSRDRMAVPERLVQALGCLLLAHETL